MHIRVLLVVACHLLAVPTVSQCTVHDLNPGAPGAFPNGIVAAFGQDLYFTSNLAPYGVELYKWDATSGLHLLADINPFGNSNAQEVTACCTPLGPRIFFNAFYFGQGAELWMSDGTGPGTVLVKDIHPGSSSSNPDSVFACHDRVFFSANDGTNGGELWVSDGTLQGTYMVKDIHSGASSSNPDLLACFDGKVFFTAYTAASGRELYVSDGTTIGTQMVKEINPGTSWPSIHMMTECNGQLFFPANDGTNGAELWTTDGTPGGTVMVADIAPNSASSSPLQLTCCGDTLLFTAQVSTYGRELWKSDGTAAGTVLVKDVQPGSISSLLDMLTCSGDRLFFSAYSNTGNGNELWVSDGTTAGTYEVTDINPGAAHSAPQQLVAVATGVCFYAVDAAGAEPWFSDGTPANTFRICDINPAGSSSPMQLTVTHGRLFFAATHPTLGNELFEVQTPGAVVQTLGQGGLPSLPTLQSRDNAPPVLGTTIDLDSTGPTGGVGFLVAGPSLLPAPGLPFLTERACDWANLSTGQAVVVAASVLPTFSYALPVPNQPSLTGSAFNLQTIWLVPPQTPLIEPSNGLQIVVGGPVPQ